MKKYSLITTYYCDGCSKPNLQELKNKFNFDCNIDDFYLNFSNIFNHSNIVNIPNIGISKRKDLVYGKIFLLKEFIENNILNQYEFVCHIDFSDTKFNSSFLEMMEKFEKSNEDIILSTEKNAWPYIDELKKWTEKSLVENEFTFLNSGALIAKTTYLYDILCKLSEICLSHKIDFWDDQGVWQYYDLCVSDINKDYNCEYFFSTALLDDTYFNIVNNKVYTKFGTQPYLIHDNSSFSLNLIKKI